MGSLWNGYHSYNIGSKYYESTFKDGKIVKIHKEESVRDNSFSDNLKTAVIGGAVLYGLYKLFSGGSSSSSSDSYSSSCECDVSYSSTNYINGIKSINYSFYGCGNSGSSGYIQYEYSKYKFNGSTYDSQDDAISALARTKGCSTWTWK
jgi:hypothetical protein